MTDGTTDLDQRRRVEDLLRRRFLAAGGSSSEWEDERDGILAQHRRDAVLSQPIPDVDPTPRDPSRPVTVADEAAAILSRGRRL